MESLEAVKSTFVEYTYYRLSFEHTVYFISSSYNITHRLTTLFFVLPTSNLKSLNDNYCPLMEALSVN
jgi:hypothetical protein